MKNYKSKNENIKYENNTVISLSSLYTKTLLEGLGRV